MLRPFVYVNMAMSADGKITSAARESPSFTSRSDRTNMDRLRAHADAVLLGGGTLRADNPPLHIRDPEMIELRRSFGKPGGLLNIVVSASMQLDLASRFFAEASATGRIIVTVEETPKSAEAAASGLAEVWRIGRGRVDIPTLLQKLHARGVENLLVEGGGELNWHFFSAGVVDELYVTICPALLGGRDAPTLLEGDGYVMTQRPRLELLEARPQAGEIFCRYRVLNP